MSQDNLLAVRLTAARKENKYTQEEIAEYLNCGRATITNYENGRRSPDYDTLIKLSKKYNVTTDYLLGLTNAETTDKDIRYICDYTGLSLKTVRILNNICNSEWCAEGKLIDTINYLLEDMNFECLDDGVGVSCRDSVLKKIDDYFFYGTNSEPQRVIVTSNGKILTTDEQLDDEINSIEQNETLSVRMASAIDLLDRLHLSEINDSIKKAKQDFLNRGADNGNS